MNIKQFNWRKWIPGFKDKEKEELKVPISDEVVKEKKPVTTDTSGATKEELDFLEKTLKKKKDDPNAKLDEFEEEKVSEYIGNWKKR